MHEEGEIESGRRVVAGEEQGVDRLFERGRVLEPPGRILGEGLGQEGGEGLGQRGAVGAGRLNARGVDALERRRGPGKGRAREHLEELGAEAEDVRPDVEGRAAFDLGGQEAGLADPYAVRVAKHAGRQAEAADAHLTVMGDVDELRDQEAVGLLLALGGLQRRRGLARDQQGVVRGEGMALGLRALHEGAHGPALEHLVGRERGLVDAAGLEAADHLGVLDLQAVLQAVGQGLGDLGGQEFGAEEVDVPLVSGRPELNGAEERAGAGSRVLELQDEPTVSLFGLQVAPRFTDSEPLGLPASGEWDRPFGELSFSERYTPGDPPVNVSARSDRP